ncbi:MAG: hypothetical protein Q8P03_01070 [bacterium]|nr:hypothetical protein [bacterium]
MTGSSEVTLDNWALEKVGQLLPREVTVRLLPTAVIVAALKKELCEGRYNDPVKVGQALDVLRETFPEDGVAFRAMLAKEIWPSFAHPKVMERILEGWSLQRWPNPHFDLVEVEERNKLMYEDVARMARGGLSRIGPDAKECFEFFVRAHAEIPEDGRRIELLHVLHEQCLRNMILGATPADLLIWVQQYTLVIVHMTDIAQVVFSAATSDLSTEWLMHVLAVMPLHTPTGQKVIRDVYAKVARAEESAFSFVDGVQPYVATKDEGRKNPHTPFQEDEHVRSFDVYVSSSDTVEVLIRMHTRASKKTLKGLRTARDIVAQTQKINLQVRVSMPSEADVDRPETLTL